MQVKHFKYIKISSIYFSCNNFPSVMNNLYKYQKIKHKNNN